MLEGLDDVPWAELEHAYGPAYDVPALLRELLDPDEKTRSQAMHQLYGNVIHQGTRYPATPYVVPFLIEMCADPAVPDRPTLLRFWGSLIVSYFSVRTRPEWGDGERIHIQVWGDDGYKEQVIEADDPYSVALNQIYLESLKGHTLLLALLGDDDPGVRACAAWVMACMPTKTQSLLALESQLNDEPIGWVRAAIAFALGEFGAVGTLRRILAEDDDAAARCMAACQLARIAPTEDLIEPLLPFVDQPIDGYDAIPGAGSGSVGDAAYAISLLPRRIQPMAIPAISAQLDHARSIAAYSLVNVLLSTVFDRRKEPIEQLTDLQRAIVRRLVVKEELWTFSTFQNILSVYGLPREREANAELVGIEVSSGDAMAALQLGLTFSDMNFLAEARKEIEKALHDDPTVIERAPAQAETWLLYAKAFAETDPERALTAYQRATALNPAIITSLNARWSLVDLLKERGLL